VQSELKLARVLQCCVHAAHEAVQRFRKVKEDTMFNSDIGRKLAALACTIVFSATCVLSAVLPAQSGANSLVAELAARPQA
jgi:hypothetical protein